MKDKWEMKPPYKKGDEYWILSSFGSIQKMEWTNNLFDELALMQGNTFPTQEAIELEIKRRNLLTRLKAFGDECNNGWKPYWCSPIDNKYFIFLSKNEIRVGVSCYTNPLSEFGYFKHFDDCKRAIELFGEEIKELYVDREG